jgi:EAL and modified HD-GYP domain-containing signal transduction protein
MDAMHELFLGRQPIFDRQLEVVGYELLYRAGDVARAEIVNGDEATARVLLNSFIEIGLPKLVGPRTAFINLTRNFIVNQDLLPPASEHVVLEVLEDIEIDGELVGAISRLAAKGYTIALDDFVYNDNLRPLVEVADIVKIDLRAVDPEAVHRHVELLRQYPVRLLAEKVETPDELNTCRELGFDLFQGNFLCSARNVYSRRLPANRMSILRLLAKLQRPQTTVDELERVVAHDVTLSYKLLRYLNSAAFFGRREITSIRHAIVYLGERAVRNWASLIALAAIDDKPPELISTSLVRGRMCELLARAAQREEPGAAFIAGMFSVLDAIMDAPLTELLDELPLAEPIRDALLYHRGPFGDILENTVAYDRGEWGQIGFGGLDPGEIGACYVQAVEWGRETMAGVA